MAADAGRPVGFLLLMIGFGLRLDTEWQAVAWLFFVAGAVAVGASVAGRARAASVRAHAKR